VDLVDSLLVLPRIPVWTAG